MGFVIDIYLRHICLIILINLPSVLIYLIRDFRKYVILIHSTQIRGQYMKRFKEAF